MGTIKVIIAYSKVFLGSLNRKKCLLILNSGVVL